MEKSEGKFVRMPPRYPDTETLMSPIAVLVLDGIISVALGLGALYAGFGWISAFFFGWAGGAVVTILLLSLGVVLRDRVQRRRQARRTQLYQAWEVDSAKESALASRRRRDDAA